MFRVQTKKERIAQANNERIATVPSTPRSGSGAMEPSSKLKGSSNTARAARISRFSDAHLPKNQGGIKRRNKPTPPQAPFRGARQTSSPDTSSRGASQMGIPVASTRGASQMGIPVASSRGGRQTSSPGASSRGGRQTSSPGAAKRKSRGGRQTSSRNSKRSSNRKR
jgi:hypothetical protein